MINLKKNIKKLSGLLLIILVISFVGLISGQTCSGPGCGSGGGSLAGPNNFAIQPPGENIGSGVMKYYDKTKQEITDQPFRIENGVQVPNDPLTTSLMQQSGNLKDTWNSIQDDLRVNFLKENPDKVSELTAEQLTLSNNLRDIIRDPATPQIWEEITKNNQKATDVLKRMGYPVNQNSNLNGWKWDIEQINGKTIRILKYGENGPKILIDYTNNLKMISFNKEFTTMTNKNGATFKWNIEGKWEPVTSPKTYPKNLNYPDSPANAPAQAFGGGGQPGSEFQQALQLIQQIAGIMKELRSNGQGQTTATQNNQGGTKATLEREAALALEDGKGNPKLLASQNDKGKPAEVNTKGKSNEVDIKNANIIVPEQLAAKVSDETTLVLNGIDGDDPNNPPKTYSEQIASLFGTTITPLIPPSTLTTSYLLLLTKIKPLSKLLKLTTIHQTFSQITTTPQITNSITAYFITGKTTTEINKITSNVVGLGGQSIELEEHNLELNGHEIDTYALKTFNELKAGGQNLKFYSGESILEFNNQQTLFNRLPKKIPYGAKLVVNKLDQNNKFNLKHYTNRLGELTEAEDENKRISVGDITTKHPTKNLIIAEIRKEMWPKK